MKVCLIGFSNMAYMPYMAHYTGLFDRLGIDCDVVYWDRNDFAENSAYRSYVYGNAIGNTAGKIQKLWGMAGFRRFVLNHLNRSNYDYIVVLTTLPLVLIGRFLLKNYRRRYIADIRDYTYEGCYFYRRYLKNLLGAAARTVISSPDFAAFLPAGEYSLCHNFDIHRTGDGDIRARLPRRQATIRISYIGQISYFHEVKQFIAAVANDDRFRFQIYGLGRDNQAIADYCRGQGIGNVTLYGRYKPEEKESFFKHTDILFNAYGNDSPLLKYALSNKLYDAAYYKIPLLVSADTAMARLAKQFSFVVDYRNQQLADELYDWYNTLNWSAMEPYFAQFVAQVTLENRQCLESLENIFAVRRREML